MPTRPHLVTVMDENIVARVLSVLFGGLCQVEFVGIGDAYRQVKAADRVEEIDLVEPFRDLLVTPDQLRAQSGWILDRSALE